jgi:hypothetical protein
MAAPTRAVRGLRREPADLEDGLTDEVGTLLMDEMTAAFDDPVGRSRTQSSQFGLQLVLEPTVEVICADLVAENIWQYLRDRPDAAGLRGHERHDLVVEGEVALRLVSQFPRRLRRAVE